MLKRGKLCDRIGKIDRAMWNKLNANQQIQKCQLILSRMQNDFMPTKEKSNIWSHDQKLDPDSK